MKLRIIPNPRKPWALKLARDLRDFLGKRHRVVRRNADATVCIGGDGTILYAYQQGRLEGAVLGIGSEKSYICQLRRDSWKRITRLLERKQIKIMPLEAYIGKKRFSALNDFVIHATRYRVVEMAVAAGGKRASFEGDGMVASSALGSAAYAYSAGGRRLKPQERKMSLVPICPYKRAFLPRVLGKESKISITVGSDCAFIADGVFIRNLRKGEIVRIRKGKDVIFFEGVGR